MFVESVDNGVLGGRVLFSGKIKPDYYQLSSTSQNISPTLQIVTQRINSELLSPACLIQITLLCVAALAALLISHIILFALVIAWLSKL